MKRVRKGLAVAAVALVMGSLAAGCGGSGPVGGAIKTAISSLSPSRTAISSRSASIAPPAPTAEAPATGQAPGNPAAASRSEEHTSELQSLGYIRKIGRASCRERVFGYV